MDLVLLVTLGFGRGTTIFVYMVSTGVPKVVFCLVVLLASIFNKYPALAFTLKFTSCSHALIFIDMFPELNTTLSSFISGNLYSVYLPSFIKYPYFSVRTFGMISGKYTVYREIVLWSIPKMFKQAWGEKTNQQKQISDYFNNDSDISSNIWYYFLHEEISLTDPSYEAIR